MKRIAALPIGHGASVGYVYLAGGHPEGLTKIGRTAVISQRFIQLSVKSGFRVKPLWAALVLDMERCERLLQGLFKEKRRPRTEWFNLSQDDIAFIKREVGQHAEKVAEDFSNMSILTACYGAAYKARYEALDKLRS